MSFYNMKISKDYPSLGFQTTFGARLTQKIAEILRHFRESKSRVRGFVVLPPGAASRGLRSPRRRISRFRVAKALNLLLVLDANVAPSHVEEQLPSKSMTVSWDGGASPRT
jgi:hypothetical protein